MKIVTLSIPLCIAVWNLTALAEAQFTFKEREVIRFATDTGPADVALGDFNGDGVLDIIVINAFAGDVSVLIGEGQGAFHLGQRLDVGRYATQVKVGDFNGDLVPDLAVGHSSLDRVSILLGRGDGTFFFGESIEVGVSPSTIETADLNRDGILDLAVGAFLSEQVSIHLGRGDGTFFQAATYHVGRGPNHISSGDFNGDGIRDLAITNSGIGALEPDVRISILIGNGDGSFVAAPDVVTGLSPMGLAVADVNGDFIEDLVVTNWGSDSVSIVLGDGTGHFNPFREYAVERGPTSVILARLHDDPPADLVVTNSVQDSLSFLRGHGDGSFDSAQHLRMRCCEQSPLDCRCAPRSPVAGHVTSELSLDLVVPREYARDVALYINGSH